MENEEMLEQTNETEKVETETTEEITEGIELTDTSETDETQETGPVEEIQEVKKSLRDILKENPEYQKELEDTIIKPRLSRKDREYQKELSKYKDTENVLKSTLKVNDDEDVNQKLREYYEEQGIELPSRYEPGLSSREIEALAKVDVDDIVAEGNEAMVNEANRLASKGYKNLNERERYVFTSLAEKLTEEKDKAELLKLGAKESLLSDKTFNEFRKKFNSNVSIKDIYDLYMSKQPKPKVESPGSMKNSKDINNVKDFYTFEEASKVTKKELDENPKLLEAIENSMTKW